MKFPTLVLCLVGLLLPAQSPSLNGTYTLVSERSSEAIQAGIQRAVAHFGFPKRHLARYRLNQTNRLHQSLSIRLGSNEHLVQFDARPPMVAPAQGQMASWLREDGERFQLSFNASGEALIQRFEAEDGKRTNLFRLDPDGTHLRMEVTVTSPRLPEPLAYTLLFRRKAHP